MDSNLSLFENNEMVTSYFVDETLLHGFNYKYELKMANGMWDEIQ